MRAIPFGARVLVKDIPPEASLVQRAGRAGLTVILAEENVPKPTSGTVVAVGNDPLIQELVDVGDVITFGRNSGVFQQIEGEEFRAVELREIITCIKPQAVSSTQPTPPVLELLKDSESASASADPATSLGPDSGSSVSQQRRVSDRYNPG